MSGNEALASNKTSRVAGEGRTSQFLKANYPVALPFISAITQIEKTGIFENTYSLRKQPLKLLARSVL